MVIMINYGNLFFPFSFFIIHYSLFIKLSFIISLRLSFIIYQLSFIILYFFIISPFSFLIYSSYLCAALN